MKILAFNAGSSSLKFQLLELHNAESIAVHLKGVVENIGSPQSQLRVSNGDLPLPKLPEHSTIATAALTIFQSLGAQPIDAIVHRVVHGGEKFIEPTRITDHVVDDIEELRELAPLHNEAALQGIHAAMEQRPQSASFAVFDTSFHQTMPPVARRYAIPTGLDQRHQLHRFGFHGISHRYISNQLLRCMNREAQGTRLITCHLGNGASICAVRDGKSVDTSMGLTPLEGLVMGTRCGDIDPGLVLHLLRVLKMSVDEVDDLLNHQSGLKGISGKSSDVRELNQAALAGDSAADFALECFAYRCRKYIGAYAAAMGGLDSIAFSGGIGEHSPEIRKRVCQDLEFLGISLDIGINQSIANDSAQNVGVGSVGVWVIPTDEERQMAIEIYQLQNKE